MIKAGICGSDTGAFLHGGIRYGVWDEMVEGHEGVGRVCQVGANVGGVKVGDIVYIKASGYTFQGKVLNKPIWNSDADEPDWEVETTNGSKEKKTKMENFVRCIIKKQKQEKLILMLHSFLKIILIAVK